MASTTTALNHVPRASDETQALVDAERLRIARELHDVVAFSFATIHVQAGVAVHLADQRPDLAAEALAAIKAISAEASRELRAILGALRRTPGAGDGPSHGVAELDGLAATTTRSGVAARVVFSGQARGLPPAVDRAAYRIVQEALTNAVRHAGPASAVVTVRYEPNRLVIQVVDDGRGLKRREPELDPGHEHGIVGMRERALALGGELDAGPDPQGGFRVRASLPIGVQS
jgi:signal transduction histidine kinase